MTLDEYAIHFCNNNDVPFATDSKKYRALVNVITQAFADEREACAKLAETCDRSEPSIYGRGVSDASKWIAEMIRSRAT